MARPDLPTTLFKAIRRTDGKNVCIDVEHLSATTKVVKTFAEYERAISEGWSEHPDDAMRRLEAQQDEVSTNAAIRAYDDKDMSEKAKKEAEEAEQGTVQHIEEIPEAKKRGRPKKGA